MTTVEKPSSNRRSAIVVGLLYIAATIAGVLTVAPLGSLKEGSGILANAAANSRSDDCLGTP